MNTGDTVENYIIGPQLGRGGFGKIFAARDLRDGKVYAIKSESEATKRKSIEFETKVLKRIRSIRYFPMIKEHGVYKKLHWITLELIGPSLSAILKNRESHKFGLSTGLRASIHVLRSLKALHSLGFIHRDIKPANILVRLSSGLPLCLIDFGLVRVYRDQRTHAHLPPRQHTGFRGTKTYASYNAHIQLDLSRRDDLISWFYFTVDILIGGLPWKGVQGNADVMLMKKNFDIHSALEFVCPELEGIWLMISKLRFEDDPDYDMIESILVNACHTRNIKGNEPYDWDGYVQKYKESLSKEFDVKFSDDERGPQSYITELGIPPTVLMGVAGIREPLLRRKTMDQSTMQLSELNEIDGLGCCC
jgi:serine/threonine protein kinase